MKVARSTCYFCSGTGRLHETVPVRPPGYYPVDQSAVATTYRTIECPYCIEEQPVNDRIKIEPDAEMRRNALVLRQWYIALVDQGFTEEQALKIIGSQIGGGA